ncbi:MAG: hypothetical protein ACRD1T_00860, partial [Acidimicrobiia bacterium]
MKYYGLCTSPDVPPIVPLTDAYLIEYNGKQNATKQTLAPSFEWRLVAGSSHSKASRVIFTEFCSSLLSRARLYVEVSAMRKFITPPPID